MGYSDLIENTFVYKEILYFERVDEDMESCSGINGYIKEGSGSNLIAGLSSFIILVARRKRTALFGVSSS
jgi:hypothetical protein